MFRLLLCAVALCAVQPHETPRPPTVDPPDGVFSQETPPPPVGPVDNPFGLPIPTAPFENTNPEFTEDGKRLHQSDMVLTEEQEEDLRSLRKANTNTWPLNSPVQYVITSSSAADTNAIKAGLAHWSEKTCVRFQQMSESFSGTPHLRFVKKTGCWSYVGRISSWTQGQEVSIGNGCTGLGTVAHEVGHAMGFSHEQCRQDRDSYVRINLENVQSGKESNFKKQNVNNFSVPYDLTSVMHYGRTYFTKNGQPTIQVLQPFYDNLIGSRAGLSHRDVQLATAMYRCAANCGSQTCYNGGFTDQNCRCACPPGTSGSQCQTKTEPYYGKICGNTDMRSAGTITSPNYPSNYPTNQNCYWLITAPAGRRVKVTFTDMKMLYRSGGICHWDHITLRYSGDVLRDDEVKCDDELKGQSRTSTGNQMLVKFTSNNYPWYKGFSAQVTFV